MLGTAWKEESVDGGFREEVVDCNEVVVVVDDSGGGIGCWVLDVGSQAVAAQEM